MAVGTIHTIHTALAQGGLMSRRYSPGTLALAMTIVLPAGAQTIDATTSSAAPTAPASIIYIDNDEQQQQQVSVDYKPLKTDDGKTKAVVGAQFPILMTSEISSKTAKPGDPIAGVLKYDLKIGDHLIAAKGSPVRGHVDYVQKARTPFRCTLSTHRWTMTSGCIGIKFDELINKESEHIPLMAEPARASLYVKNNAEGRVLGINHKGQIAAPYSKQVKYMAIRMGLNAALTPAGVFSFGAAPLALGIIGAANPSFAFGKAIGTNVRHRRVKGFFWAAFSAVPGSFLIEGTTVKGEEVIIKPGDEFLVELRQEFTGEPAGSAELAGAQTKVHGEVMKIDGKPR